MRKFRTLGILVAFLGITVMAKAQIAIDTLSSNALNQLLIEQIERLADEGEEENDYEELLDNYIFYSENPINLNSEEIVHLAELQLINAFQLEELRKYRRYYGDFLFLDELEMVEGFDEQTINILRPIVCIREDNAKDKITGQKLARYGKHQVIGRYEQVLEKQQGYYPISDEELLDKPNSRYLGSPQKYELRYSYNYRNKIRAGFALKKDAGELFFNDKLSDTIKSVLGNKRYSGFDFFGFHLHAHRLIPNNREIVILVGHRIERKACRQGRSCHCLHEFHCRFLLCLGFVCLLCCGMESL